MQLSHKIHRKYLGVTVTGRREVGNEISEVIQTWASIVALCEENGLNRILAILDIKGRVPPQSALSMGAAFEKVGWKKAYKLAIIASPETLTINVLLSDKAWAGMGYTMKLFHSRRSARRWLLQRSDSALEYQARP